MNNRKIYETIMSCVGKEVKKALLEEQGTMQDDNYFVYNIEVSKVLDDYFNGELDDPESYTVNEVFSAKDIKSLILKIAEHFGINNIEDEQNNVMIFVEPDGQVIINDMVDANGNSATIEQRNQWKNNDRDLYNISYCFYVQMRLKENDFRGIHGLTVMFN